MDRDPVGEFETERERERDGEVEGEGDWEEEGESEEWECVSGRLCHVRVTTFIIFSNRDIIKKKATDINSKPRYPRNIFYHHSLQ